MAGKNTSGGRARSLSATSKSSNRSTSRKSTRPAQPRSRSIKTPTGPLTRGKSPSGPIGPVKRPTGPVGPSPAQKAQQLAKAAMTAATQQRQGDFGPKTMGGGNKDGGISAVKPTPKGMAPGAISAVRQGPKVLQAPITRNAGPKAGGVSAVRTPFSAGPKVVAPGLPGAISGNPSGMGGSGGGGGMGGGVAGPNVPGASPAPIPGRPPVVAPTAPPVTAPGNPTAPVGSWTSTGSGGTFGQDQRRRRNRGPSTQLSMTPELLQRLAAARVGMR